METEQTVFKSSNNSLQKLHDEANVIQAFMNEPCNLQDPNSMTERLCKLDAYMSRLGEMNVVAKAIRSREENAFVGQREDLNKLTATASNRIIKAHMEDYNILYDRIDTMYETIRHLTKDLVTQISYVKEQMRNNL